MAVDVERFDGALFWMVTSCGILGSFIPVLVKMVLQIITGETEMEASLRRQVCDLKAELGSTNMVDEFAKYAKIQRKINKVTDELSHQSQMRSLYTFKVRIIASAALYVIMALAVLSLLWNYSDAPIVTLPERWLYPLGPLLAFPSNVPGAIGLTPWLVVSGTVGKIMANSLS